MKDFQCQPRPCQGLKVCFFQSNQQIHTLGHRMRLSKLSREVIFAAWKVFLEEPKRTSGSRWYVFKRSTVRVSSELEISFSCNAGK